MKEELTGKTIDHGYTDISHIPGSVRMAYNAWNEVAEKAIYSHLTMGQKRAYSLRFDKLCVAILKAGLPGENTLFLLSNADPKKLKGESK